MYFNGYATPLSSETSGGLMLVTLGFLATLGAMTLWFRDVFSEGTFLGDHTFPVKKGITMGVALFILSEVFFFVSVFLAYLHSSIATKSRNWFTMATCWYSSD